MVYSGQVRIPCLACPDPLTRPQTPKNHTNLERKPVYFVKQVRLILPQRTVQPIYVLHVSSPQPIDGLLSVFSPTSLLCTSREIKTTSWRVH